LLDNHLKTALGILFVEFCLLQAEKFLEGYSDSSQLSAAMNSMQSNIQR